jgi:hypothetical protein
VNYVIEVLQKEFPSKSRDEISQAVNGCFPAAQPDEDREKLITCAREILR